MPEMICELCERTVAEGAHYVVRMEIFADPSMPPMSAEEVAAMDFDGELKRLLDEMKGMSAEQLQDQVYRKFEYRICRPCQIRLLLDPLGKMRRGRGARSDPPDGPSDAVCRVRTPPESPPDSRGQR